MKVFLSVASLKAAYGGPAVSVSSLAETLARLGLDVGVWAADQSARENRLESAVRALEGPLDQALRAFGRPHVIHDNGLWLMHNHQIAVWAAKHSVRRVVSTRGMLEPWARRHKRWKKEVAWHVYQRRDLVAAEVLHATSPEEAANLSALGLGRGIETIPNGVDLPKLPSGRRRDSAIRTALFLGRMYPVKGLPMLIEAWAQVRPAGWRLEIAGPDEAGHRKQLEGAVGSLGLGDVVSFAEPLGGVAKTTALAQADLFVLPSHSESFGMVVAEALAHATPVLTTTAVPWPDLLTRGCGWRADPTASGLAEALGEATARSAEALDEMGLRGRTWMREEFSWDGVARRFVDLYSGLGTRIADRPVHAA